MAAQPRRDGAHYNKGNKETGPDLRLDVRRQGGFNQEWIRKAEPETTPGSIAKTSGKRRRRGGTARTRFEPMGWWCSIALRNAERKGQQAEYSPEWILSGLGAPTGSGSDWNKRHG